ncbi:MAG: hypothetical protein JWP52_1797 [Rhizobacter sp.]|nr:hypothetical protein [Rhizobacter sp.]
MTAVKSYSPRFSLATWLTGVVLATVACAVLATVVLVETFARRHAERAATASLQRIAWTMRDALDRGMSYRIEQIHSLAMLSLIRESDDAAEVRRLLDELKSSFPQFAWVGLVDNNGLVFASAQGMLEGADVASRPWNIGARDGAFVGDVHTAPVIARMLPPQADEPRFVDIAVPVLDFHGQRRGILAASLNWTWARSLEARMLDPALREQGTEVLVLARDGTVLIGPKALEGKTVAPEQVSDATAGTGPEGAASTHALTLLRRADFHIRMVDGQAVFTAVAPTRGAGRFTGLGWTVVVRQPVALALADYRELRNEILAAGAAVCVLFCFVAAFVARRLSSPLRRMARTLESDEVDADPEQMGLFREAHQLAVALRDMTQRQRRHAAELHAVNESLETRITERTDVLVATNRQLCEAQTLLRGITDNLPVLISYIDRDLRLQFYNATYQSWFGVEPRINVGRPIRDVVGHVLFEPRRALLLQALTGERLTTIATVLVRGQPRDIESTYVPHIDDDGQVLGLYAVSTDVSELKDSQRRLEALARVDTLSGLPNRLQFNERLPDALARGRRTGEALAVLFVDVDRFKQINDTYGHATGDAVLKTFAQRLKESARETDTVARLAGDEFVLILEGLRSQQEPRRLAEQIVARVTRPMVANGHDISVCGSVGIAFCDDCLIDPEDLLARADEALYQAKKAGRNTYRLLVAQ